MQKLAEQLTGIYIAYKKKEFYGIVIWASGYYVMCRDEELVRNHIKHQEDEDN